MLPHPRHVVCPSNHPAGHLRQAVGRHPKFASGCSGVHASVAATAVAQWREYLVDKMVLQAMPMPKQELLDVAEQIFAAHTAEWD